MDSDTPILIMLQVLQEDPVYGAIEDHFERMVYMVERYRVEMEHLGESMLALCQHFERLSRKQPTMAHYHLNVAKRLFSKHQSGDPLSEQEYSEMVATCDQAVRLVPLDWTNVPLMVILMEMFVQRAVIEYDRADAQQAMSDLRHASSIFSKIKNREELKNYFEHQDKELLVTMVGLQVKLLQTFIDIFPELDEMATGDMSVDGVLELIINYDSIIDDLNDKEYEAPLGGNLNYRISDKIRLDHSEKGGRFFVASEPIFPGEEILVERANSAIIFWDYLFEYCNYCHKNIDTFWPCSGCTDIGYCSVRCSETAFEQYHRHECGIYGLISCGSGNRNSLIHAYREFGRFGAEMVNLCEQQEMMANHQADCHFNVQDYFQSDGLRSKPFHELSHEDRQLLCRSMASLMSNRDKHDLNKMIPLNVAAVGIAHCLMYKGLLKKKIVGASLAFSRVLEHISTQMMRFRTNAYSWVGHYNREEAESQVRGLKVQYKIGSCLNFASTFLNHSCHPNVEWKVTDGIIRMKAKRLISPGEQLHNSYGPRVDSDASFVDRQTRLQEGYCFFCQCVACLSDCAAAEDTLRCLAPGVECRGPLVLTNKYDCCLECGYKLNSEETLKQIVQQVKEASNAFMDIISGLHQDGTSINQSMVTPELISQLEAHFKTYLSMIYGGSYHLLEKCALLLKVYHQVGLHERGLSLIDQLDHCLQVIYPEMTDQKHSKLIYALDQCAFFFDQLSQKITNSSGSSGIQESGSKLSTFCMRLYSKLQDILWYDVALRGDFFPMLHLATREERNFKWNASQEGLNSLLDQNEHYFVEMYRWVNKRLTN